MKYINILVVVLVYLVSCRTTKMNPINNKEGANKDTSIVTYPQIITDTLVYAKSIVANKNKYINKPFSVLLNDLKISIKAYSPDIGGNRYISTSITFFFVNTAAKYKEPDQKLVYLGIVWQKALLNSDMITAISTKSNNRGDWGPIEEEYFSNQIVGDIICHQH